MAASFIPSDRAYIVESNHYIREVEIIKVVGGFCTVRFTDRGGGIKVRESRLYPTKETAEASLAKKEVSKKSHWDH